MLTMTIDEQGIALLRFDNTTGRPNILSVDDLTAFERCIAELFARVDDITGVIVTGGEHTGFLAGVDVNEIAKLHKRDDILLACEAGQSILAKLHAFPKPTVAAINGTCLGGGLELALHCDYRIVADDRSIRIGLPEVALGIIPGFGGTQRLSRLIGFSRAIDAIAAAKRLLPKKAYKMGIVDEVVPPPILLDVARSVINRWKSEAMRHYLVQRKKPKSIADWAKNTTLGRALVSATAKRIIDQKTGGHYPAPLRAIDVTKQGVFGGGGLVGSIETGLRLEREAVADLLSMDPPTSPARHLLDIFKMRESHRKDYPGRTEAQSSAAKKAPMPANVGVVGAGFMGGGIAQLLSFEGVNVRLKDVAPKPLGDALKVAADLTKPLVKSGRLLPHERMALLDRISTTIDASGFNRADFIIEAVVENLEIKKKVFAEMETVVPADCVLASNTSSLSITRLAEALNSPERVVGLHFFSPVHKMPLIEIIKGERTDAHTVERAFRLAVRLGKVPVVCTDRPGFVVNRILGAYLNEAAWVICEGVSPTALDTEMRRFGMPLGPFELMDEVGLKVANEVAHVLRDEWPDHFPSCGLNDKMAEAGLGGKRSAKGGFYRYAKRLGRTLRRFNPDVTKMLKEIRQTRAAEKKNAKPSLEEARDRLLAAMVNEAQRILADAVAKSPDAIDTAMVFGTGFPPFRGGLLRYAKSLGKDTIIERLKRLQDEHGNRFAPAETWQLP